MAFKLLCYIWRLFFKIFIVILATCRNVSKCVLRHLTRLCELQRAVYGDLPGYPRTRHVELALLNTEVAAIRHLLMILDSSILEGTFDNYEERESMVWHVAKNIAILKQVNLTLHAKFVTGLSDALLVIYFVRSLGVKLETSRNTIFVRGDLLHEAMLRDVWTSLTGEKLTERYSKDWQRIGFQGNDPATDFRGTGLLGLKCLLYFSKTYPDMAKKLLQQSQHPTVGYPFACLSLHMTFLCFQLLSSGVALTHFYNSIDLDVLHTPRHSRPKSRHVKGRQAIASEDLENVFYDFYSAVLVEFNTFWVQSKPKNLLDFGPIKQKFVKKLEKILSSKKCIFRFSTRVV